jgi:hypothetical protein
VFSNRPYYRFDLPDLRTARELLHAVQTKHTEFEISIVVSALYSLYNLPPLAADFTSCAMLLAQCMRLKTPAAHELTEALMPAFRAHVEAAPPLVIPRDHLLQSQGKLREMQWLRVACGTIDSALDKNGEDSTWLRNWRIESGHMPRRVRKDTLDAEGGAKHRQRVDDVTHKLPKDAPIEAAL